MDKVRYSIETRPYSRAVQLMKALRTVGIQCNEDVGCVAIYCLAHQSEQMSRICQEIAGEQPLKGNDSTMQTLTLMGAYNREHS